MAMEKANNTRLYAIHVQPLVDAVKALTNIKNLALNRYSFLVWALPEVKNLY